MTLPESRTWFRKARPPLYVLILLLALAGSLTVKLRTRGVFACPASYAATSYLSDCNAAAYGDYDHGAFWFGLEPEASRAVADAKVVFLGNSRLQFALSTPSTMRWFAQTGISFYLLGFSHSETVSYFAPLLPKIGPRAHVFVVNVDRFFDDRVSPPTAEILQGRDILARYKEKQSWQMLHRNLCGSLSFFCGNEMAVYRARGDGTWRTSGALPTGGRGVSEGEPSNVERWPQYVSLAKNFMAQLDTQPQCVVLTLVPTVQTKRAEAQAIADALGLPLIAPRIDDLKTFDGSHLDPASADRWAAAFLESAGSRIRECAAKRSSAALIERGAPIGAGS